MTGRKAPDPTVEGFVADLFRRSFSRLVSSLTGALGASDLHLAEECVQDALVGALRTWPFRGVPDDPEAWLFKVARNRALDRLRRGSRWQVDLPRSVVEELAGAVEALPDPSDGLGDEELALVILCCHPVLSPDARVTLTLRLAAGLSVREIAAAFLAEPATVAQRIVRAKRTLRKARIRLGIPPPSELAERLDTVLRVIYLLFNEGYAASEDDAVVRKELCDEAVRLGRVLAEHRATRRPDVDALLALMLLQSSRLPTRTGADGGILVLEEQDRRLWDRHRIQEGLVHLARAGRGPTLSAYHLEAGIAAVHAVAPSFERTDWRRILSYYDLLLEVAPSPVVAVNRAVALSMVNGAEAGLRALEGVEGDAVMERYPLLPVVQGTLLARAGRSEEAAVHLRRGLMGAPSRPARRFVEARLAEVEGAALRPG
ncbi:MAG: sigma-70 family RNA polymerase sigma factor [Gemmatimonadota bacterium]